MAKQFTLGKNERLKSRKQIELLFSKGKKFTLTPYRIFFLIIPKTQNGNLQGNLNFGTTVSARNFKKAVDRNRIKRLTREAWRVQKNELKERLTKAGLHMNVFFIYTGKGLPDFLSSKEKVGQALKKLSDKINENLSENS